MKKLKKIMFWIVLVIFSILSIISVIFVRFDIQKDVLENDYFLENSEYKTITINDLDGNPISTTIHYQDLGKTNDEVVLLIHGTFSSSHTFNPWAETLVESGYRVIMLDLPYFGLSDGFEDQVTSYRRSSEVIKSLLDELSIDNIHIAGNSLGGAVSWFFTSEYQEMTLSLTLIDAVYPVENFERNTAFNFVAELGFVSDWLAMYTPKFLMRNILESAYGDPDNIEDDILTRYYELLRKEDARQTILKLEQEVEPDFSYIERLESIYIPVFIIWGKKDSWIPVETVDLFKTTMSITESNIYIYPSLGHVPMEENPSDTVEDYLAIIQSINIIS